MEGDREGQEGRDGGPYKVLSNKDVDSSPTHPQTPLKLFLQGQGDLLDASPSKHFPVP